MRKHRINYGRVWPGETYKADCDCGWSAERASAEEIKSEIIAHRREALPAGSTLREREDPTRPAPSEREIEAAARVIRQAYGGTAGASRVIARDALAAAEAERLRERREVEKREAAGDERARQADLAESFGNVELARRVRGQDRR